ncbi:MAG: glycosyltransferase family 4 protein [Patescibacteria group bacterium]
MKKILIATGIFPPDIGGPATYAKLLADHFGDDVHVMTYTAGLRKIPWPLRQVIFFFRLWRASRDVDVIYSLSPLGTGIAAALLGKPFVVRVAGDRAWEDAVNRGKTQLLLDDFQNLKKRGRKHRLQVWVCLKAKRVVVPSSYLAGIVVGWGIPREKITIVANSADLVVQPLSKEEARKELGLQGNVIISVGRLVPWKGFRMLIKIVPQFLEINPFFRLVIVGDGPDRTLLETMIHNLNLQKKVHLVGKKSHEELIRYLQASEIMILNSGYEGFSHQLLEAMMIGVPVIASNMGGNRELVRQGENGFMVKYNDEFNLVEAVKTLWASPELRTKFTVEGKKTAAQYTPERTVRETKAVLDTI